MALIRTDSQNYTDIANAVRTVGDITLIDETVTTEPQVSSVLPLTNYSGVLLTSDFAESKEGDSYTVFYDGVKYLCRVKTTDSIMGLCIGNTSVYYLPMTKACAEQDGITLEEYLTTHPQYSELILSTGEPFLIFLTGLTSGIMIYTPEASTHHVEIRKSGGGSTKQMTPEEMTDILSGMFPDYGVSYDTFDANGNVLTATTYGSKVIGLAGNDKLTSVNISNAATEIGLYAFDNCDALTDVVLPDNLTIIGGYAFYSCGKLNSINLHDNITSIGGSAFYWCGELIINKLPSKLTYIGSGAFDSCYKLYVSEIPEGVTKIYDHVFRNCTGMASFTIHKNVTQIGSEAFYGCRNLTTVTFEGTPSSIEDDAFENCSKLTTINVPWAEGKVANAPWGATNATIKYNYVKE